MTENMKKYMEALSANEKERTALEEELRSMDKAAQKERIMKSAQTLGIELADEDIEADLREIPDEALDDVAGGRLCFCALGGGGVSDVKEEGTCACVSGGVGTGPEGAYGDPRCGCVMVGAGVTYS